MRVQIEFDEKGEIRSVAGCVSVKMTDGSTAAAGRFPRPGHSIFEADVEGVRHERDFEGLRSVMKHYRVIGHPQAPRLARSSG